MTVKPAFTSMIKLFQEAVFSQCVKVLCRRAHALSEKGILLFISEFPNPFHEVSIELTG